MRTIIDILRKGNQELFHSSMVAWLLDRDAEHGLGTQFLDGFADVLADRGHPDLKDALASQRGDADVSTEVTSYKSRYDIVVRIGDQRLIIENKTKSLGAESQLDRYKNKKGEKTVLVALGLTDISFSLSEDTKADYPVLTYRDMLSILRRTDNTAQGAFGVLIRQYAIYLERELSLLDSIDNCYARRQISDHGRIPQAGKELGGYTGNDVRFFNWYYLKRLRAYLKEREELNGISWATAKNMRSGAWLSNYPGTTDGCYAFSPEIQAVQDKSAAKLWFHLDLSKGVAADELEDTAGRWQLKAECEGSHKDFAVEIQKIVPELSEGFGHRFRDSDKTFTVVSRSITKQDLEFRSMAALLVDFMRGFGAFSVHGVERLNGG